MTVQITIVGLGQIGASIGLSLAEYPDQVSRIGHDQNFEIARQAEKMGALDKVAINLPSAVRESDMVLLSLPIDQIRDTLALIAPELKQGAVVMDTSPVKEVVAAWASELLPEGRHYIGLLPVLNPAYLHTIDTGLEAAHADLFRQGLMAIIAPPRSGSEALKAAADLVRLIGATPLFADPAEVDGVMAATHVLPQLLAAALLNATLDQPGWREGRRFAGRAYAEGTGPIVHLSGPKTLSSSVLLNRHNVLRMIDASIAALQAIRADIHEENGSALEERLERARQGRERWWQQRQAGAEARHDEEARTPTDGHASASMFDRLLGLGRKSGAKQKR
jgi:prephenate dehydrogenase